MADGPGRVAVDGLDQRALRRALRGHQALIHLSARVPRGEEQDDPAVVAQAWAVNVGSVAIAMQACEEAGVRRFIHMSSLAVFSAAGVRRLALDEVPDSLAPYGLSKRIGELVCDELAPQLGLDALSIRIGWPTSDELAPTWLCPSTDGPLDVVLSDGTAVPAISATETTRFVLAELEREFAVGHRSAPLVAVPSSVFDVEI